jgi:hypothetical protein
MRGYLAMAAFLAAALCLFTVIFLGHSFAGTAWWATGAFAYTGTVLLLARIVHMQLPVKKPFELKLDREMKRRIELEAQLRLIDANLEQLCKQVDAQAAVMASWKELAALMTRCR